MAARTSCSDQAEGLTKRRVSRGVTSQVYTVRFKIPYPQVQNPSGPGSKLCGSGFKIPSVWTRLPGGLHDTVGTSSTTARILVANPLKLAKPHKASQGLGSILQMWGYSSEDRRCGNRGEVVYYRAVGNKVAYTERRARRILHGAETEGCMAFRMCCYLHE